MIDLNNETLITLADAAKLLPCRRSVCTLWRWRTKGVRGRKLESVQIGAKVYTSREALFRFARHGETAISPTAARSPAGRNRALAAAEKSLAKDGI